MWGGGWFVVGLFGFLYVCVLGFVVRVMGGVFYVGLGSVLRVLGSSPGGWLFVIVRRWIVFVVE